MAGDSIGSVSVDIRGDYSRLQADFAGAQAAATKAGTGIAAGVNSGLSLVTKGTQQLSLNLAQTQGNLFATAKAGEQLGFQFAAINQGATTFGRTVTPVFAALTDRIKASKPVVDDLGASIRKMFEDAATGTKQHSDALNEHSNALGHGATQIQAVGGALRTAFGEQSIRAVERFLTMIPGVGNLLQKAFPLIGAIALIDMFSRVMSKSDGVKQAMQELKTAVEATDKAFADLVKTGDQLLTHAATRDVGAASGAEAKAQELRRQVADLGNQILEKESESRNAANVYNAEHPKELLFKGTLTGPQYESEEVLIKRKALAEDIKKLTAEQAKVQGEANSAEADAGKARQERTGTLGAIQVANQEKINQALSAWNLKRIEIQEAQNRGAEQLRILGITDAGNRSIAEAEEELRIARDKAGKLQKVYAQELSDKLTSIQAKADADQLGKSTQEQDKIRKTAEGDKKVAKIEAGTKALDVLKDEEAAERKLGEAHVTATRGWAEQVTREWEKSFEARRKDALRTFEEENAGDAYAVLAAQKVAEVQTKGKGPLDTANIQKEKLRYEQAYAAAVVHTNAEQLANAQKLAAFDAGERAVTIADLNDRLKLAQIDVEAAGGTEKQIAAKEKVQELVNQIAETTAKSDNADIAAQTKILELKLKQSYAGQVKGQIGGGSVIDNATAAAANLTVQAVDGIAGALAKAAVQGKHLGDIFVNLGKQLATSLLTSVLKVGLDAVLKSLLNLIPVFGTVAAAQASAAAATKATQSAAAVANVVSAAGEGAAWAFESVMAAVPFPVNVALAPGVAAATFGEIMGFAGAAAFAEGGRPPVGVASIIGEKGPELWIPDQAGQIIPAGKFGSAGVALPSLSGVSSSQSQSIGELHVHAHGVTNPKEFVRQVARELPNYLKTTNPVFSPASR